jgi:hypothetical protein
MRLRGASRSHVLLNRSLGESDAHLTQLPLNTFRTPQAVLACHLPNQGNCGNRNPRLSGGHGRLAFAHQLKQTPMPP